jgi:hypothetical protein
MPLAAQRDGDGWCVVSGAPRPSKGLLAATLGQEPGQIGQALQRAGQEWRMGVRAVDGGSPGGGAHGWEEWPFAPLPASGRLG